MVRWHVFNSVTKHYNPYSGNFASLLTCPTTDNNPYSGNLASVHHRSHVPSQRISKAVVLIIAVKVLGMLQHTNPLSLNWSWYWEILFSLAVKMPNFWGQKIDKNVINSFTKCLISVNIAILTPHIIPPPLVNIWLTFDFQKYVRWLCMFWEINPCFQKAHIFCMDLQPAADPYNVVCSYLMYTALSLVFSTSVVCVKTQQKQFVVSNTGVKIQEGDGRIAPYFSKKAPLQRWKRAKKILQKHNNRPHL